MDSAPRLSLLCLLAGIGCNSASPSHNLPERTPPKPPTEGLVQIPAASKQFIDVKPVAAASDGPVLRAPAHVAFRDGALSQVGAPFAGRVTAVHVKTGDQVRAGEQLVTLSCPDAASARAALATATAALREARSALERETRMLEQGVGVERDKLAAEVRHAEAEAEVARARAASAFVGGGAGTTVVLRAPMSGTVIARRAAAGAAVEPGSEPLVEIGDPRALWIVAEVFERDLPLVRAGAAASIELPSLNKTLAGKVVSVGAVVASSLRTAPVRIALDGAAEPLRPGMFGRARIASAEAGLTLPTAAVLIKDGTRTVVFVEKGPLTFERRSVAVAQPVEGRVQVTAGIAPGDRVVVRGALLLDGAADQLL